MSRAIRLRGAAEHNLQSVDLDLPHGEWIAVVGPSGSGKTSLVADTLVREGQHRYLSGLSARARQFFGKLGAAQVRELTGLPAAIAVGQRAVTPNARSTVGTLTGTLDLLRLLFARVAVNPGSEALTRSHFSFNHPLGACASCGGLGVEDSVDPALLVRDAAKSIRDGALVPTLKSGYTVYSQVTLDVLDTICRAHGFDVHTPWRALTDEQRGVVLYGSRVMKVPFGKHPIESRMKWEGITARPREEGYYKGLVPVLEETLKRNRNPNVLRFVRSIACTECGGSRLSRAGREARLGDATLPQLLARPSGELIGELDRLPTSDVLGAVRAELDPRLARLVRLGLGHLALDRESTTLSGGEGQRVRLAAQLSASLSGVLYALDEPTLGLHPGEQDGLRSVLEELRELGNTLVVVEHDPDFVRHADRLVRLGPGAGPEGGRVLEVGAPPADPLGPPPGPKKTPRPGSGVLTLKGATLHNLRGDDFRVHLGALNVVLGPSGAGKSSLVFGTLLPALTGANGGPFRSLEGVPARAARAVDARPIGRTPRSTPATFSGLMDLLRKRFATTDEARALSLGPGHFSYNNKAGRCTTCEGLGTTRVGLHLLEDAELVCESCGGGRFGPEVLAVHLDGRTIADVLALSVREAAAAFADDPPLAALANALDELGLGYLALGQPSNHLSRGEAQRVKLATLLGATDAEPALLLLDEPDRGLHPGDVELLLAALERLVDAGHTVVAVSHHRHLWAAADHRVEVADGALREDPALDWGALSQTHAPRPPALPPSDLVLTSVRTNNLAGIDVRIPRGKLTALCGVSGSGKSSLAFDTLAAESWHRFAESLPFAVRRHVRRMPRPVLDGAHGLGPAIALRQSDAPPGPRSTVATQSGIGPLLRLLMSRAGELDGAPADRARGLSAEHFSPDRALGACADCAGRGVVARCDPARLVTHPERSLADGAFAGTKPGAFFTEPDGRHLATLHAALWDLRGAPPDLSQPWRDLPAVVQKIALEGAGPRRVHVMWEFAEDAREGETELRFDDTWHGFLALVEREAARRAKQKSAAAWAAPLVDGPCTRCAGSGLADEPRRATVLGRSLPELLALPLAQLEVELAAVAEESRTALEPRSAAAVARLVPELRARLAALTELGLGALELGRRADRLSGGERQRLRLADVLHSGLTGVTLVLDEPTAGLGPEELDALLARLRAALDAGNTVVVVEHDPVVLQAADHLIELGPGAGRAGGRIVGTGSPAALLAGDGPTATALRASALDEATHASDATRMPAADRIVLRDVTAGPLRGLDVDLPRAGLVVVRGPSGSGKSTLLFDVLGASARSGQPGGSAQGCARVEPAGALSHFRAVHGERDRTHAGTVLAALGLAPAMTKLFHAEAREHTATAELPRQAFSFLSPRGACPTCRGTGRERVALDFLADLDLVCPTCEGKRYRAEVLAVRWRGLGPGEGLNPGEGLDPAEFLEAPASELRARLPRGVLRDAIDALEAIGLDHLALGRATRSLSGGEGVRLELAAALARSGKARSTPALHLLDEPGTGLHPTDVTRLVTVLRGLAERGDLVVAVDRRPALVAAADEVLDLARPAALAVPGDRA